MAPIYDLVRDLSVGIDLTTQHEKGCPGADQVEGVQYRGGRVGMRTVIEGQDRAPSRCDTLDAGVPPPAGSAAGVPFVQSLTCRPRDELPEFVRLLERVHVCVRAG